MPIVGGLDIHRKQLTFDYLDTERQTTGAAPWPRLYRAFRAFPQRTALLPADSKSC